MIAWHLVHSAYEPTFIGKPPAPMLSADQKQALHLARLAADRAELTRIRRSCSDCGLSLAVSSKASRCATCAAKRKLEKDRYRDKLKRKVNGKFVGRNDDAPPQLT